MGPARARRADQPPRRRRCRLARRPSQRPQPAAGAPGRHPRPVVPRRGQRSHLGGPRRAGRRLRRRLLLLRPGPGRTRPDGRRHRATPAEPRAQRARLAAPGTAGSHVQAALPHRCGQRADRRRAARPRRHRPAALRHRPARQDGLRPGGHLPVVRRAGALRRRHLAGRSGRPGRHRRGERRRQVDAAQDARRPGAPVGRAGQGRPDRQGGLSVAGGRRARPGLARARGGRADFPPGRHRRRQDDLGVIAVRPVRLHRQRAMDPGRRPVRWRAPPPPGAAPADG